MGHGLSAGEKEENEATLPGSMSQDYSCGCQNFAISFTFIVSVLVVKHYLFPICIFSVWRYVLNFIARYKKAHWTNCTVASLAMWHKAKSHVTSWGSYTLQNFCRGIRSFLTLSDLHLLNLGQDIKGGWTQTWVTSWHWKQINNRFKWPTLL